MSFINFKQNWNLVINEFINKNTFKFSKIMFENLQLDYQFQLKQQEDKFNKQIKDLQNNTITLISNEIKLYDECNEKLQIQQLQINEIIEEIEELPNEIKEDIIKTTGLTKQVKLQEDFRLLQFDFNKLKNNMTLQKLIEDFCLITQTNFKNEDYYDSHNNKTTDDVIIIDPLHDFRCKISVNKLLEFSKLFKKFLVSNKHFTEDEINSEFMTITPDYTQKYYVCRYNTNPRLNGKVVCIHFSQIQHLIN